MALASTMVFEVRPGSGSDTQCSGGFNSARGGTDYTLQAAAQATGTATSASTTLTATTGIFTSAMVGNTVTTDGTAANTREIIAFTSSTIVTLDAAPTWTAQTIYVGGAKASIANVETMLGPQMVGYIQADGTNQVRTTAITLSNSGDSTSGVILWRGYHVTRGDHDGTRPLITCATNNVDLIRGGAPTHYRTFDNIAFSSTAGTPGNGVTAGTTNNQLFWTISNCKISGCKNGIDGDNGTYGWISGLTVIKTEIASCTAAGALISGQTDFIGCYIHGNTTYGVTVTAAFGGANTSTPIGFRHTVVKSNSSGGIYLQAGAGSSNTSGYTLDLDHNVIRDNINDGIQIAIANTKNVILLLINNIVYGNLGYGVNLTNVAAFIALNQNNAYGSNTSGPRNNLAVGTGDVTLTADPNTNAAGNDFSENATAGGGAATKAAGFPGTIAGCATAGSADVGAVQGAGGTSGMLYIPSLEGI